MAWTETELQALRRAYASGTTRVTYDGKTVEYDSGAALLQRIRIIEGHLETDAGNRRPSVGYASFSRR